MSKKNTTKKSNNIKKETIKKNRIIKKIVAVHRKQDVGRADTYKKGLLEVDKEEEKYDKLFEKKLAEQYREFRNLKEHHMLLRRFIKISGVLVIVILVALLLLSFS
jgi:hypothetical protein